MSRREVPARPRLPWKKRLAAAADLAIYRTLRHAPIPVASAVGAVLGAVSGAFFQKVGSARAMAALRHIRPEATEAERRRMLAAHWRHMGRVMTEYSCLRRLLLAGRIEISGLDALPPAGSPVVVAASHTGSWETISIAISAPGHSVAGFYEPIGNKTRLDIALGERRSLGWIGLAADDRPVRPAIRHMDAGGAFCAYVDEYVDRVVRAPRLGRDMPLNGNIRIAVRLAERTGCPLVFGSCERIGGARFRVTFTAVPLTPGDADATVDAVEALLDAAVRRRPEQWLQITALRLPPA